MNSEKTTVAVLGSERTTVLVRAAFLVGTVIVSPLFLAQPITGVFVNMALVLAALSFGVGGEALLIAVIPSMIAFFRGQLPAPLFPLIPFIITGNIILVATVHFSFRKYGSFALSAALGSLIKFVFLAAVGFAFAATYFAGTPLSATVLTMLGWLQLATALGGSVVAYAVLKIIRFRD
ncbi:MAG: hypothetical protein HGA31_04170 [Candidatus Moranbacteria bacterium]|nr:hypothetical protein [Candidatus Moranbacteria bacterium]